MTLTVVLVVAVGFLLVVGLLRTAQLRSVPLGAARAAPAQGAGPTSVEVSADASLYPYADPVQDVISRYFEAINRKSYSAWAATVMPARAAEQPEAAWREANATTTDGTIRISRIDEQGPNRLVALVSYTSSQRPENAPPDLKRDQICWRVAMSLIPDPWRIDVVKPASILRGPCS